MALKSSLYVAAVDALKKKGRGEGSRALLMGLTFKRDVKDTRNSPAKKIIKILKDSGLDVIGYDPLLEEKKIEGDFHVKPVSSLDGLSGIECLIIVTDHGMFSEITSEDLKRVLASGAVIADIRGVFDRDKMKGMGFEYLIEF